MYVCMYVCMYVGFGCNYVLPSLCALREECAEHIQRGCCSHGKGTTVCMLLHTYNTYIYIHAYILGGCFSGRFFFPLHRLRGELPGRTRHLRWYTYIHIYIHLYIYKFIRTYTHGFFLFILNSFFAHSFILHTYILYNTHSYVHTRTIHIHTYIHT